MIILKGHFLHSLFFSFQNLNSNMIILKATDFMSRLQNVLFKFQYDNT